MRVSPDGRHRSKRDVTVICLDGRYTLQAIGGSFDQSNITFLNILAKDQWGNTSMCLMIA